MKKRFGQILLFSLFTLTFGVYATQLTWDAVSNGSTIDDGAWTWKVWVSTFNDGATSVVWATGSDVVIWNWWVGWTITVSGTVIPNSILFSPVSSNYTLSGGIIKLTNANTTITASWATSPIINSVITGTGWLVKLGVWTLTLGGTNTYTGNTVISEWTVIATNANAFGLTGSISVADWATLDISWLSFSGQDNIFSRTTVANGWTLTTTIQTVKYDFESDVAWTAPANMQIEYKGIMRVWSISGINGNGAYVYINSWAQMPISSLLTNFPSASDYSITWLWAGSWTNYKNWITLRAQPTPYYKWVYSWSRLWYLFQVGTWTFRIFRITSVAATQLVSVNIAAPASYVSRWYKAMAAWTGLIFYYSDISNKWPWTQATKTTDATYIAWYTQYSDGWNSLNLGMGYIDDITMQYQNETPVAPDKLSAPSLITMGSASATFAFTGSTGNNITQYTLTANPWAITTTGTTSPLTISWLTPGTTYAFTISAQNSAGSSTDSDSYTGTTSISSTINYSTTWATSGNVIATLTWLSGATITNNGWNDTYTFTWNGSFTFTFTQWASTWSTTATVNWIDKTAPTWIISYSTTWATNGNVIATLTWLSESVTITNNGWASWYTFTDNGTFTFNFVDAVGNTWSAIATVSWINTSLSLTVTSPVQYQIAQRDIGTNKGDIVIAGTYAGSFSWIEASWNGWLYKDISASMAWWIFTGKLTNQTGGQWSLTVRITSSTWISVSVSDVWVWDIFIVAGQSNAVGQGSHNQIYTGTNGIKATLFANDYIWKQLTDPYDATSGQIDTVSLDSPFGWSFVPLLATKIVASQNIPVAFVPTAKWGTHIWVWAPWTDHFDRTTLYGSMAYRIAQVWWKVAWILWFQWETDVVMNRTTLSYETYMNTIVTTLQSDFPSTAPIKFFVWSLGQNNYSWVSIDAIRKAQQEVYTLNSNIYKSWPITYDIKLSDEWADTLHFKSDWDLAAFTERWWNAISREYYGIVSLWSPRVISTGVVLYTSWNKLLVPFDTILSTQVPTTYTNNLSWITYLTWSSDAFWISGANLTVQSVSLSGTNSVVLSLSGSIPWSSIYLNYANGVSWVNKAIYSSWTYQPAYPIYSTPITIVDNSAPIISLNGSGTLVIAQGISYTDSGASWTDNFDGSASALVWLWWATGSFVVSWSVNTNIPGTYYIQYNKVDTAGNTTITTRTVIVVDSTPVAWTISYSTTWATNGNVIATITLNKTGTITNNGWNTTYTFTWNWVFTFNFVDLLWLTWSATATVNNIDKVTPTATIEYSKSSPTSWNVIATLTWLSESVTITNNGWINNYTFTNNGTFTFNFVDVAGNTGSTTATVSNIDKVAPTWIISYSTTWTTNGNVIATLTWLSESVTITNNGWSSNYTFTDNGTFTFNFSDAAGNTGSTTATVNNIDKSWVYWTINYSTTWITNGNVIATISLNRTGTITNNGWSTSYTFTWNGTFAFTYIDVLGNTWSTTATVNNIDKVAPSGVVSYSTTWATNGNVIATLTWLSESVTITNNGWSGNYTFTWNGTFTFNFVDAAGNTWSTTATVNNIDKSWISWTIAYSTTLATSGNVTATITLNKTGTIINNGWSTSYVFTWNGNFTFNFVDAAGNTWSTTATVNNIDKVAPTWVINYSTTWTTNGNVIATLTWLNESVSITNNGWSSNYTFTWNGSFTFNFVDVAGNTGSTTATVNNIDNTPLPVIDVSINTWSSTSAFTWGAIVLTGTTSTWATFWWTWEIIIYARGSLDNSLSFVTSGTSILASWRDSTLSAPTITADTWMAQFGETWVPSQDTSTMTRQIVTTIKAWSDISSLYITGAYFKISYKVDAGISGNILKIIRSEDWNVRESNTPDAQCILDSNKICTFYTDRLSYFATIKETLKQTNSGWGGGGWGGSSSTTTNPTTTVNTWTNNLTWTIVSNNSWNINTTWGILPDYMTAYNWAFENGITTKPTIQQAKIDKPISRAEMAKMISQYAVNVEYKIPNPAEKCNFKDISKVTPDLIPYIKEVCQLGIMGRNSDGTVSPNFNPYGLVTRAQFATMLSRVLYGNVYDTTKWNYRDKHMQTLYNKGIIKAMNPIIYEQRWWIFLMLYRSSK